MRRPSLISCPLHFNGNLNELRSDTISFIDLKTPYIGAGSLHYLEGVETYEIYFIIITIYYYKKLSLEFTLMLEKQHLI